MENIVLKTFKGGNVTPQDDAIIYQTAIPGAGIFKGCEVTVARGNVLHISQGFGMIKGRFFEMYENEISVQLADTGVTLKGRVYIHLDLSNADEPISIKTITTDNLPSLDTDSNINYNNSIYELELAVFTVDSVSIQNLNQTFSILKGGSGGGGIGGNAVEREHPYKLGDTATNPNAPGWCTLVCTQAGATAIIEPLGYSQITNIGDKVLDGTCIFEARATFRELTDLESQYTELDKKVTDSMGDLSKTVVELSEQMAGSDKLVQKIMCITDYQKLKTYDKNTMYYCYDNADTQEIKFIYLGEHVIYATGINVTYQIDTDNAIKQVGALSNDIVASAPSVTKAGYTFVGWKSDKNADEEVLSSYILNTESDVTVYAVFKKSIEITMDSGDATLISGKRESSQTVDLFYNNGVTLSSEVTMPENVYEYKDGDKVFCGWKTNLLSEATYVPRSKYRFTKEEELVPVFIDREYDFLTKDTGFKLFKVPADGIYEFELWGGKGGDCSATVDNATVKGLGGKGGHVKAYKKCKKDTFLYVYNGGKGGDVTTGAGMISAGANGGANGYVYAPSSSVTNRAYGAGGGGATYVATTSINLTSQQAQNLYRDRANLLLMAGGGGGAGVSNFDNTAQGVAKGAHNGGYAGGEKGEDGSGTALGGRQTAVGTTESQGFGAAIPSYNSSGTPTYSYAGGGAGWFSGQSAQYGNSAAGGSSYVGNMPTFTYNGTKYKTLNEKDANDGHGYAYIRYVEPCEME